MRDPTQVLNSSIVVRCFGHSNALIRALFEHVIRATALLYDCLVGDKVCNKAVDSWNGVLVDAICVLKGDV